jgi:hypothetical protein
VRGYDVKTQFDFGGLWLVDQPGMVDERFAIDALNVRGAERGGVEQRPGVDQFSDALADEGNSIFLSQAGADDRLLVGVDDTVHAVSLSTGAVGANSGAMGQDGPFSFAAFETPSTDGVYMASGAGLAYYNGTTFTLDPLVTMDGVGGAAGPKPRVLAVAPWDQRLWAFGGDSPGAAPSGPSYGYASSPVDAATWDTQWREQFSPGDGEELIAACVWRDRIFVFKQSKFFVIYGTTVDSSNATTFDFYAVDTGVGAHSPLGVCAGTDGVYFVDRKGVYKTTGQDPVRISAAVDPLFLGGPMPYFSGSPVDLGAIEKAAVHWHRERLYVSYPVGGVNTYTLVYEPRYDRWDLWDVAMGAMCTWKSSEDFLMYTNTTTPRVFQHGEDFEDDDGAEIESWWQGCWQSFGSADESTIRQSRGWGSGNVALAYASDLRTPVGVGTFEFPASGEGVWGDGSDPLEVWGDGSDPDELWGSAAPYADAWVRHGVRGHLHSPRLRGVAGDPWSIQRIEHHLVIPTRQSVDSLA